MAFINISDLPQRYQEQVLEKYKNSKGKTSAVKPNGYTGTSDEIMRLMALEKDLRSPQVPDAKESKNKFRNLPTERLSPTGTCIRFQSTKEAKRYDYLLLQLKAGVITELKLQPEWTLQEAYSTPEGLRMQAIRYRADFSYVKTNNPKELIVEDVKCKATNTPIYRVKKKLLHERYGITVTEI